MFTAVQDARLTQLKHFVNIIGPMEDCAVQFDIFICGVQIEKMQYTLHTEQKGRTPLAGTSSVLHSLTCALSQSTLSEADIFYHFSPPLNRRIYPLGLIFV